LQAALHTTDVNAAHVGPNKPVLQYKRYEEDRALVLPVFVDAELTRDFITKVSAKRNPRIRIDSQQPISGRTLQ
jgi:hypothetical protein